MRTTRNERIALDEYLTEYPQDLKFETILDIMSADEISYPHNITPCEFFEDWNPAALAARIKALNDTLERRKPSARASLYFIKCCNSWQSISSKEFHDLDKPYKIEIDKNHVYVTEQVKPSARALLVEIANEFQNDYLSSDCFADHNGLFSDVGAALIALAQKVRNRPNCHE